MTPNFCDRTGAEDLARMIEAYWRERGYPGAIDFEYRHVGFVATLRGPRVDLRTNMVNGLPMALCAPSLAKKWPRILEKAA